MMKTTTTTMMMMMVMMMVKTTTTMMVMMVMIVMMVMTNLLIRDLAGLGNPSMLWMLAMLARLFSLHDKNSLIFKILFMLVKLFSLENEQRLKDTSLQKQSSLPSGEWGVKIIMIKGSLHF